MDHSPQNDLRRALHRFLDLCREVRGRDLDPYLRNWLSEAELYVWACLAQYRHTDAAQQRRLLACCMELDKKAQHLIWVELPEDRRSAA